jgi:hypothetical protein
MRRSAAILIVACAIVAAGPGGLASPAPARAGILGSGCSALGTVGEGWWGKACNLATGVGGKLLGAGKKASSVVGKLAGNSLLQRAVGVAAIVAWVLGGAKWTIDHMAGVISQSSTPTLTASWFTGVYLRIEGLALFFTLLFLVAAAAEALLRSDVSVLARAVFGYLPLAALATAIAAPVTMLLLAATDQLSAGIAALAGNGSTHFLTGTGAWVAAGLTVADPFFAVLAAGLVVAAGGALWVELLIREVAVYVVVAMLPVAFAAMVWPARRVWAIRAVELLVALILSKVAIVAVLALGGAALAQAGAGSLSRLLGGLALILLGAFTPWLLLRLIPIAEVASAAVGHIRGHAHSSAGLRTPEAALAGRVADHSGLGRNGRGSAHGARAAAGGLVVGELLEQMQRRARTAEQATGTASNGAASAPGSTPATNGAGATAAPEPTGSPAQMPTPAAPTVGQDETMVQRPDGSWEPLAHTDPDEPIAPPPWEAPELPAADADEPTRPSPPADPQQPPLGGDGGEAA